MIRPVNPLLLSTLDLLTALGGTLNAVFCGLYTARAVPITPTILIADLTQATYTGYARQAITPWTSAYLSSTGLIIIDGPGLHFVPTDAVTPNTIMGWFIASLAAGGILLAIEELATPVPLLTADSTLTIVPRYGHDPLGTYPDSPEVS